ncbi:PTS glucitol/sorbitol transporter subunit IIA [Alicyclobacillus fastidiosus]|uniref:PTS glucitol/sorbitol transporter subunit IIA n=1 Tax=Alicyclobacillus fastidiosus TaxID=392011 RepID=A0ABV5AB09_9BACL|nr:PTS glucitol/sorbitol transporter subunit IIA [Alicyclobacillus fastidiosus]WEH10571.1 PTS glucitol/sorbitol transporter subunit IIA [Alicyclobacillus fastidiosus]
MKSVVTQIGEMALQFEEDHVIVFFGPKAPNELRDISLIHEPTKGVFDGSLLLPNHQLVLGEQVYDITRVGSEAANNFEELGHISVYFTEPPSEILPGAVYVKPHQWPDVQMGMTIEFR